MAKLPKTIHVERHAASGNEGPWLEAVEDPSSLAEVGKKTVVGVYRLERVVEVEGTVTVRPKR